MYANSRVSPPYLVKLKVFPEYLSIRKALKANQPDVRGSGQSFAKIALATLIALQES
jgi:hypothetical protein